MNYDNIDHSSEKERRKLIREQERAQRRAQALEDATAIHQARKLRGWTQTDLARHSGVDQRHISKIENAEFGRSDATIKLKRMLGLTENVLVKSAAPDILPSTRTMPSMGAKDLALYGCVEAGDGHQFYCLSSDPIDMLPRPALLANVPKAYAVMVSGTSMVPCFRPGWTLYINPHLPPVPGHEYLFYNHEDNTVVVKHLLKVLAHDWRVCQYHPIKEFELPRRIWTRCERVVLIQPA